MAVGAGVETQPQACTRGWCVNSRLGAPLPCGRASCELTVKVFFVEGFWWAEGRAVGPAGWLWHLHGGRREGRGGVGGRQWEEDPT